MEKGVLTIKTNVKGISGVLLKKILVLVITGIILGGGYMFKSYIKDKLNITGSIFEAGIIEMVSLILIYILLGILILFVVIAAYKFLSVFYELGRETIIDFDRERILIKKYDFPFEKETLEKKFNRIVGVEIRQRSIERAAGCGDLYIEYLVLSKNDSKLRVIEVPYVENPELLKSRLMES